MASETESNIRVDGERMETWLVGLWSACGLPAGDASILANGLVAPSLRGVDSHGLVRIPQYVENFRSGRVNPHPDMRFDMESGSVAHLAADNGSGHVACARAMEKAVELARRYGVGVVSVRDSSHFGAAATWAMLASEQGCIGIVATNGPAVMPPTGGREPRLSNNPIAVAAPAGKHPPLVLDMAMSIAAGGKLRLAIMSGQSIPEGWALNKAGEPTTDPREATNGLLLPIGGHKGYGLALMVEVLAGVLSGSAFGTMVRSQGVAAIGQRLDTRTGKIGVGHFVLALDVTHFMPLPEFVGRVDELIDQMHDTPLAAGATRVLVPGELEDAKAAERTAGGIPIPAPVFKAIEKAAASVNIEPPLGAILT